MSVVALMWLGTAVSAVGAIQQGRAADAAAKFNAQVANQNAQLSRDQAQADATRMRRMARKQRGAARAAIGASGINVEGSPLDILEQSAYEAELDIQNRIFAGEVQATGFENEARLERFKGKMAKQSGFFRAGSSLLLNAVKVKQL